MSVSKLPFVNYTLLGLVDESQNKRLNGHKKVFKYTKYCAERFFSKIIIIESIGLGKVAKN